MSQGLSAWLNLVGEFERQDYWPGPRPLRADDPDVQLVGRSQEVRDATRLVVENQMLVLHGATGDGKSSLLNKGIRPNLARLGMIVLHCNEWAGSGEDVEDGGEFLRRKLRDQLPTQVADTPQFLDRLDTFYGERAVIVLDQFEELIRHEPSLFGQIWDWILQLLEETQVRIIVSLREEYLPQLRVGRRASHLRRDFRVEPIRKPETIREVIRSGRRKDGIDGVAIDVAAEDQLVSLWSAAGCHAPESKIGLLHLQALLYVLWRGRGVGGVVSAQDVAAVVGELTGSSSDAEAIDVFTYALPRVAALRLTQCEQVYLKDCDGEPTLASGATSIIRRMSLHLSSGGYKVDQDRWHLAELVLADELSTLGFVDGPHLELAEVLFGNFASIVDWYHQTSGRSVRRTAPDGAEPAGPRRASIDFLEATRAQLRMGPDGLDVLSAASWRGIPVEPSGGALPWEADPFEVTGGMMMGATPVETLLEVYRLYFFALEWLDAGVLIRKSKRGLARGHADETAISLIHDGFGIGLAAWANRDNDQPREHFDRLVAARGKTIVLKVAIDGRVDPSRGFAVNLRWTACLVTATFRHVTFVNCDFRNSTFESCVFEGVTFVNCLLDGVSLIRCSFKGEIPRLRDFSSEEMAERRGLTPKLSSFNVRLSPIASRTVQSLNRYREYVSQATTDELHSLTSGVPAAPRQGERGRMVEAASGGLTVYGGRLNSLVFGECLFPDNGHVALRDLVGTSLEFADQAVGNIDLRNVSVRGFTISGRLGVKPRPAGGTKVHAHFCRLQNVWISARLDGELVLDRTTIWQVANINDEFAVIGTDDSNVIRGHLELTEQERLELEKIALHTDFRTVPAKRELLLRDDAVSTEREGR